VTVSYNVAFVGPSIYGLSFSISISESLFFTASSISLLKVSFKQTYIIPVP
jgi:hypothetical protein